MPFLSEYNHGSVEAFVSLKLTPREAEVLSWIAAGKSNHEIGVIVGASTGTIRKHVEHILGKLSVENRTAAAVMWLEKGSPVAGAKRNGSQAWAAMGGMITTQFAELWSGACQIYNALPALIA